MSIGPHTGGCHPWGWGRGTLSPHHPQGRYFLFFGGERGHKNQPQTPTLTPFPPVGIQQRPPPHPGGGRRGGGGQRSVIHRRHVDHRPPTPSSSEPTAQSGRAQPPPPSPARRPRYWPQFSPTRLGSPAGAHLRCWRRAEGPRRRSAAVPPWRGATWRRAGRASRAPSGRGAQTRAIDSREKEREMESGAHRPDGTGWMGRDGWQGWVWRLRHDERTGVGLYVSGCARR